MAGNVTAVPTVTLPDPSWVCDVGPIGDLQLRSWDLSDDLTDPTVEVVVTPIGGRSRLARLAGLPSLKSSRWSPPDTTTHWATSRAV